jgi:hypothetical protein
VDDAKIRDITTVAVWADHGDYAGDYGLVEKWPSGLEDVLTRVPLLVRSPGGARGHVVTSPVQVATAVTHAFVIDAACCCVLLRAAACCCVLLRAAACCCVLLRAAACCCVLLLHTAARLPP